MPNQEERQNTAAAQNVPREQTQAPTPPVSEKILFSWRAPERPFKKREKAFWVRVIAVASVFGLIFFVAEGTMPVILLISVLFLFYILSTVEPPEVDYSITNLGIKIAGRLTDWSFMYRFWFSKKLEAEVLVFDTSLFPGRLELVVNPKDKDKIKKLVGKYVLQEEAPTTTLDRVSNWISQKLFPSESRT